MRIPLLLLVLTTAACNVDNDSTNEQVSVKYDSQKIKDTAKDAARTAREVGSGVGNVAESTGRAIKNEVGDIDVDVDVKRNRQENGSDGNTAAPADQR